jgi:hypothetical protein
VGAWDMLTALVQARMSSSTTFGHKDFSSVLRRGRTRPAVTCAACALTHSHVSRGDGEGKKYVSQAHKALDYVRM